MVPPSFTVVLCSHNGKNTLPRTLDAMSGIRKPSGDLEIILIDNDSTDGSFHLFPEHIAGVQTTRLREPRRGKSYALNTAIAAAHGDYIAFMDDDIRPDPGWLHAYEAAVRLHPETEVFCGQVRPDFETAPPEWLAHLCTIGASFGTTPNQINSTVQPVSPSQAKGANLLIRRKAFQRARFDEDRLNYSPTNPGGEDTDIVRQLTRDGHPAIFVPDACVHHWIPMEAMSMEKVAERYHRIGRTMEQTRSLARPLTPAGRRVRLTRRQVKLAKLRLRYALAADERRRSETFVTMSRVRGEIDFLQFPD